MIHRQTARKEETIFMRKTAPVPERLCAHSVPDDGTYFFRWRLTSIVHYSSTRFGYCSTIDRFGQKRAKTRRHVLLLLLRWVFWVLLGGKEVGGGGGKLHIVLTGQCRALPCQRDHTQKSHDHDPSTSACTYIKKSIAPNVHRIFYTLLRPQFSRTHLCRSLKYCAMR